MRCRRPARVDRRGGGRGPAGGRAVPIRRRGENRSQRLQRRRGDGGEGEAELLCRHHFGVRHARSARRGVGAAGARGLADFAGSGRRGRNRDRPVRFWRGSRRRMLRPIRRRPYRFRLRSPVSFSRSTPPSGPRPRRGRRRCSRSSRAASSNCWASFRPSNCPSCRPARRRRSAWRASAKWRAGSGRSPRPSTAAPSSARSAFSSAAMRGCASARLAAGQIVIAQSCNVAIPLSAVLYGQDTAVVAVVRNDRVETRQIVVGHLAEGEAEIREGLAEGDLVVAQAGSVLPGGRSRAAVPRRGAGQPEIRQSLRRCGPQSSSPARAWTSADSTNADVTSAPPIRMRVGVFILFHS